MPTHPEVPYDDGIRRIFFHAGGNCNITDPDDGKAISDMLKYIQNSNEHNVCNPDIRALDEIVTRVRQSEEVSIRLMKSWEKDAILVKETTERVTAEVTAKVTEEVTSKVTEEVTEKNAQVYLEDLREAGVTDDTIFKKLVDRFNLSIENATRLMNGKRLC